MRDFEALLAADRARNLQDFTAAVHQIVTAYNVLYADRVGNIAYWLAGRVPVRPDGFDPRLPYPGDGSAEWTGALDPLPVSINPAQGWLANWNDKPSLDYDSPDRVLGKQTRLLEIEDQIRQRLAAGQLTLGDMEGIARDIARTKQGGVGREGRYLKPYLLAALAAAPPTSQLAPYARAALEVWDGGAFDDPVTSVDLDPGEVIFTKWLDLMLAATFGDEFGTGSNVAALKSKIGGAAGVAEQGTPILTNMLIHVLDAALGEGSGVPPSRDYFNGVNPNIVMSQVFDHTLAALGTPTTWSNQPRNVVRFRHLLYPAIPEVGTVLESNHPTYAQVIILSNPAFTSEDMLPLGQSAFIGGTPPAAPSFDAHFADQLSLYRDFAYKPMTLYLNTQLHL